jgi:hypothetical protein
VFGVASVIHRGSPRECVDDKFNNGIVGRLFDIFVPRELTALG